MSQAKQGSTVQVHYTGKLTNEQIFDSSREREPLEFTIGAGQMIPGFDTAVDGMTIGDHKQITIPSNEAYGARNEDAVFKLPKTQLPEDLEPQIGMELQASREEDGQTQVLLIVGVEETEVILDANHPLAGQDLIFDIELITIK